MSVLSSSSFKISSLVVAVVLLLFCAAFWFYPSSEQAVNVAQDARMRSALPSEASPVEQNQGAEVSMQPDIQTGMAVDEEVMIQRLVTKFKHELGAQIHLTAVQVSLKSLRDELREVFAEQGDALFLQIITLAFPEFVKAILQAIALMDQYDAWLQSMLLNLNDMNAFEQQGVLWAKRRELFGDAANQIWQAEISAEQERQLTMRRTMEMLDKAYDMQMQERLYLLKTNFEESYADKLQNMVIDPKGVLAQVFFGLDAVQQDLARLPNEERQAQINDIRKSMGFSEEQITSLAEADQEREKRWQNGYAYMAERQALEAQLSGDALNQALDALREKFFAHEAYTIKKEEEELLFFRYQRPRVYGRN